MNKEWSNINKSFQSNLNKKSFHEAILKLLELRNELFREINSFPQQINKEEFSLMPFINHKGYESKSVAYSVWHIFRIEDIVLNSLILKGNEIYYTSNYDKSIGSTIHTTGNELVENEIEDFSRKLDINELYKYINEVYNFTNKWLLSLNYEDLAIKFTEEDVNHLINSKSVAANEMWLIEYWTNKTIKGLLLMPFSRHWIMHIEASLRIINAINKK